MGGIGTLNGYPLYAFAGDAGLLFNIDFLYHLLNFGTTVFLLPSLLMRGKSGIYPENPRGFDPKGVWGLACNMRRMLMFFGSTLRKLSMLSKGFGTIHVFLQFLIFF